MRLYKYKALNRAGLTVRGATVALDSESVVSQLNKINLRPVSLVENGSQALHSARTKHRSNRFISRHARKRLSIDLTHQLSSLMQSGLSLDASLTEIIKSDDRQLSGLAEQTLEAVQRGEQFATALSSHNLLSVSDCRAIAVAEKSDSLVTGLAGVSEGLQAQLQFRRRLLQACLYPVILIVVLGGLMGYLTLAVVPQLLQFSAGLGQATPRSAYWLQQAAQLSGEYILPATAVLCSIVVFISIAIYKNPLLRLRADEYKLRVPLFGTLALLIWRTRYFDELQSLLAAGVDLLEALALLEDSSKNRFIQLHLAVQRHEVEDGQRLSEAMRCTALFAPAAIQRVLLGELTGDYSKALQAEADASRQAASLWLEKLEKRVGPVLLTICGVLILWIIVAVIAPVYSTAIGAGALL